ncbi:Sodium/glucose cotransporter [Planctomycetes bacterium Pan216]|uniref:Sodium/glucose cotransporter n=1 Tax=Kolteria novifilia TaxID=2527975 RepID=A0A518B4T7_9BACT|nr:Sodium/glucose cotransporter [Planctomycetes bacterium Pan216]
MTTVVAFTNIDWIVLVGYFVGMLALGLFFWRRNRSPEEFTAAGRSLSGWLCGLSIFATFLSSISYLALPGKAFADNWNPFMFSVALPVAALIAVRYFVPLYRKRGSISAYSYFEARFGLWARVYTSSFYLLYQVARIGVVMYLMALPMAMLFGWDIRAIVLVTGVIVTLYSFVGGITAVIWADAIQAVVLLAGALLALGILLMGMPGGPGEVIELAVQQGKFSLGSASLSDLAQPTIWVVLAFGFFDNLRNFGVDQSYVQRYIASRTDREAAKSVWFGALLYVPVSALFLFIGTSLAAYYHRHPEYLQDVRLVVAKQRLIRDGATLGASKDWSNPSSDDRVRLDEVARGLSTSDIADRIFPHFIASHLPQGVRGLLIAAVFAAAMSTVSTSLNSSATLVLSDFYKRLWNPEATDFISVAILRTATIAWGAMGTAMALVLVHLSENALDIWWLLSSVLGAATIGLFLLGITVPRIGGGRAILVLSVVLTVIVWMTFSTSDVWPTSLSQFASPMHPLLVVAVGPTLMLALGWLLSPRRERS